MLLPLTLVGGAEAGHPAGGVGAGAQSLKLSWPVWWELILLKLLLPYGLLAGDLHQVELGDGQLELDDVPGDELVRAGGLGTVDLGSSVYWEFTNCDCLTSFGMSSLNGFLPLHILGGVAWSGDICNI